jgi:hypothetical protein
VQAADDADRALLLRVGERPVRLEYARCELMKGAHFMLVQSVKEFVLASGRRDVGRAKQFAAALSDRENMPATVGWASGSAKQLTLLEVVDDVANDVGSQTKQPTDIALRQGLVCGHGCHEVELASGEADLGESLLRPHLDHLAEFDEDEAGARGKRMQRQVSTRARLLIHRASVPFKNRIDSESY